MTIRGVCDSCGKAYRVPADGRSYACKACGGTLVIENAEALGAASVPEVPHVHHESAREHRERIDARHRKDDRKAHVIVGVLLVVLVGATVAYKVSRPDTAQAAGGVARDLEAGTAELARAWSAGDVESLVLAFHPDGRPSFRYRLENLVESRGWTGGFGPASAAGASVTEGTAERPVKAVAQLASGEERVRCSLQFDPGRERWYLYHVDIPPPPLAPTEERFRAAWAQSSIAALTPLFTPDQVKKLGELVERKTRELAWTPTYPTLGAGTTTGEQELRRAAERTPGTPVETVYAVPEGELRVRWQYRSEPDAWYVANVTFPKKE